MIWGFYRDLYYKYSLTIPIRLCVEDYLMALITGSSGSGKSYALLYLLGIILKSVENIVVYFCDFKNSEDFCFLNGYEYYYCSDNCYHGIMEYYLKFIEARKNRNIDKRYLLICDEYPALINYLQTSDKQKKTHYASEVICAISEILMLGRGIRWGVWVVTQRADSSLFNNGARDNFMVIIGLGRISKEQKGMIFTGEDIPDRIYKKGEGVLLADGHELEEVKYPKINNVMEWKRNILKSIRKSKGIYC